ncbi:GH92 family glycosyl hydrolase [Coprobacter fastidiosus]|uniref:Putative alpha-1,2-mannosidase n=1 Tax=Coprobacter fastidiosus NSB1 = JCM 33896 TaxID=1349822 RepID=A0A495WG63_9BACT|nr:GH92 family glycosyl hydrolase [Coprobacter fastidiosus]ERM88512.1 alpha-1 2-mannosidase [Coprobacter fastidiosus NSB1 = JCM 33896]RKT59755.1 putative alpha-1,2-mannosidase [Coprobacter fastidiosus NSB1 = JCM 33896]BEG62091.1 GH92 family glycosyl hydrolase [Coprobacter fastidiosus]
MRNIQNFLLGALALLVSCSTPNVTEKTPVDYVNPYMGNISHLLVPTFPTIHLPNSMLRVYPERPDYTSDQIKGLPLIVTSHRGSSAFNLSPYQGREETLRPVVNYTYDNEVIKPYYYRVYLDEQNTDIKYAPSYQSAQYEISYEKDAPVYLILNSKNGAMRVNDNTVSGYQQLENNTRVYLYLETENKPEKTGVLQDNKLNTELDTIRGNNACVALYFGDKAQVQKIRYGISFISEEQAKSNMEREQKFYDVNALAEAGKKVWNDALGKIEVQSPDENEKTIFYTSLYRCYERPVNISEDGRYFSAFDGKVHEDGGNAFYTDDWIWDTYRATHPLRVLIDTLTETNVIRSYILMAEQMGDMWMPTFPEITGDSRRMNSNHAVATVADAYAKGLRGFDLEKAYLVCKKGIEEKTLAPWSGKPAGWLDDFYKKNGYIPALAPGEKETVPEVHHFEKRQPIAVTLGTSYDQWCLSQIAEDLGKKDDAEHYLKCSYNYRNVYNPETQFFHPKDKNGKFIEPFDYRFSGGQGAREYYGENNAWVYRWDVPHNVGDLIAIMGGVDRFIENLNQTFREPLGRGKYSFYAQLPDHTGNVGQFSMANEPSLHIPYLYNYAGQPWMTQKRIRTLLKEWFRNDLMGVPGDEDGGGMSAFVAFSSMGFYPVTPGSPTYNIGSPMFPYVKMTLSNGKIFEIIAENCSDENKYIQSATLNGKELNQPWFNHSDIANGGKLVLKMGDKANKAWGSDLKNVPPSAKSL